MRVRSYFIVDKKYKLKYYFYIKNLFKKNKTKKFVITSNLYLN